MEHQNVDRRKLLEQLDTLIERVAAAPHDLELFKALRQTSIEYKALGGRSLGPFARLQWPTNDSAEKLRRAVRSWGYEPFDTDLMIEIARHLSSLASTHSSGSYDEVMHWLRGLIQRALVDTRRR